MKTPWLDSHPPATPFDWAGVALGGLLALSLVAVLWLDHFLARNEMDR
ncbi:MAG TPA: hypothetical protein VF287_06880 [Usitatibacter sp.]